jgi:hypothetical protein
MKARINSTGLAGIFRQFLLYFLPVATLGITVAWGFYLVDVDRHRKLIQSREADMVNLQKEAIAGNFNMIVSDLLYLAQQTELHEAMGGSEPGEWMHLARDYHAFSSRKQVYDQVRYIAWWPVLNMEEKSIIAHLYAISLSANRRRNPGRRCWPI